MRMILSALTDYDLGFTLEQTAARLKKKTNRNVSPSTIAAWLQEYKRHCSYRRLRAQGLSRFPAAQTIRTIKLYHRQVYSYAYHRPKLEFLRTGALDEKRKGDTRFAPLADFLERVPTDCPHDLFRREVDPKARASKAAPSFADTSHAIVNVRNNAATDTAALIIPAVGNNKLRHETLQRFMLANDSVTVAVEIPIWLQENDIAALEARWGIALLPQRAGSGAHHHRPHRFRSGPQRSDPHPRLQARRDDQQAVRTAHDLRACALAAHWHLTVRFQMRVVQRASVLRIFPAHDFVSRRPTNDQFACGLTTAAQNDAEQYLVGNGSTKPYFLLRYNNRFPNVR